MIGKLKGLINSYGEDYVILDVGGVGYQVHCSARTLQALPSPGEAAVLSIETYVREDQIKLFGFRSDVEREWFRLLQTVQGVGAKVALAVLSTLPPAELANAIALRDKAAVTRTPGVGPKVAERIVTELKDKAPAFTNIDPAVVHLAGAHRRPARAASGGGRDLRAGQSRLWPAAGRGGDRAGLTQRRRECRDRAAYSSGPQGTGKVRILGGLGRIIGIALIFCLLGPPAFAALVLAIVAGFGAPLAHLFAAVAPHDLLSTIASVALWVLTIASLLAAIPPSAIAGLIFGFAAVCTGLNTLWMAWLAAAASIAAVILLGNLIATDESSAVILPGARDMAESFRMFVVLGALAILPVSLCWWLSKPLHRASVQA